MQNAECPAGINSDLSWPHPNSVLSVGLGAPVGLGAALGLGLMNCSVLIN